MRIVQKHFPELYELHRQGVVIIYDLYEYEENGTEKYNLSYRYR